MRIAYVVNQYPKVSHSFIRREIQALERAGTDVQRIAMRGWRDELVDAEDTRERERVRYVLRGGALPLLGAATYCLMTRPGRFATALALAWRTSRGSDKGRWRHFVYFLEACLVARWVGRDRVCHLHAHFGTNSTDVAMLAAGLAGVGFSFTVHGPEEFDRSHAIALAEKVARARFVVAVSSFGRSQLYRILAPAHWAKVHVVRCGLDRSSFGHAEVCPNAGPRLVCVGRICEQKGQLLLVDALAALRERGVPFMIVFAGDGELRGELERRIDARGLRDAARITGWISGPQVQHELLQARALVLPSFAEGLPVVIMEAMALGRPVVTTFVAGIPELVAHGETGWLVPAGDVPALADAIERCLAADVPTLARVGGQARQRVLEQHDVDVEARRLMQLFREAGAGLAA